MAWDRQMELNAFGSLVGSALLRHVSAEGCQLMVESLPVESGARLAVVVPDSPHYVLGTVRWLVGSRAGFAFDADIGHELRAILESQHPLPTPVLLYSA
ncbi:PilZ domain-containing protein [Novosphingobium aquimarinum]|uniref:PilZ domain-containing protein n=1 Tax=Novosphingobium aquimarinum TaxID=2682494 RepID=UPI0012EB68DB|nr:PilZ domain-containing protein [Novosphingobium aquimarinum]